MEQKNHFPIRYVLGAILVLAAFGVLLANKFIAFLLALVCLLGAAICFLPPHRMGLWIGGAVVIVLHAIAQQPLPGALLQLLLDPPDPSTEPGLLYVLYGFGAFVCFIYFFCMIASVAGGETPIAPQRKLTKILVLVGWAVFAATCCFPNLAMNIANWIYTDIEYLPFTLCILYSWGQYALIHWLFFVTIAWVWRALRKKKAEA